MAALEDTRNEWMASFLCNRDCGQPRGQCPGYTYKKIEIVRTKWDHEPAPYYWTRINSVGEWPGTESDEWIEVVW